MSHHLEIDFDMMSGPELRLVCTATPGSPCRMRPADDREHWSYSDPDLIDGECWAVEWVEAGGMETMASADDVTWPTIPVTVAYDEGVVLAPVAPHPPLWRGDSHAATDYQRLAGPWNKVIGARR